MKNALGGVVALLIVLAADACRAEVKIAVNANRDSSATPVFKFAQIASPSQSDAANRARFTLLAGRQDANGGGVERLNDGRLPAREDEPAANFFFAAGSPGGRLLVDLGTAIEIRGIASYSWHPGARGPQVYKLYAFEGAARDFDSKTAGTADLSKAPWKLLAKVDARPKDHPPGGQYGVNIADDAGGTMGEHRYLLFDVARTEVDEQFDNTFFSEIDVNDGEEYPPAAPPAAQRDVVKVGDKYEIAFDTSQAQEIKPWVDAKLKPVCAAWYPKIVEMLPSDGFAAPERFAIVFHNDMRGVAYTGGRDIHCAAGWFMENLEGEAAGAVVHEMVHVVQQYGRTRGANRNPPWMVEGVADYIRWFLYEPEDQRPRPDPVRANYDDSYRTTGAFLDFLVRKHDKEAVKKFNAAMRQGKYRDELWKEYTGKTAEELWQEYVATLEQ